VNKGRVIVGGVNMRSHSHVMWSIALLLDLIFLAACGNQLSDSSTVTIPTSSIVGRSATSIPTSTSPITPTAIVERSATSIPTSTSPITPTALAAPSALPGQTLSPTELKYRLIDRFGTIFYCDPDAYPVARELDAQEIERRVSEIEQNTEEFQVILRHTGLQGTSSLTQDQKLLIYNEHKKLNTIRLEQTGEQYTFSLRTPEGEGDGFAIEGLISREGVVTITKNEPILNTCPICLAGTTRIDTPSGPVFVKDLRIGMPVWTADTSGTRRPGVIREIVRRPVPAGFRIIHLVLDNGHELFASPGHPTVDGRTIGDLAVGDMVDNARVAIVEHVPYQETATYDVLPSGGSGSYWANGILLRSTIARSRVGGL
jgi:hypothetical protein